MKRARSARHEVEGVMSRNDIAFLRQDLGTLRDEDAVLDIHPVGHNIGVLVIGRPKKVPDKSIHTGYMND